MFLFYAPDKENETCLFSSAESHHCAKVLRLRPGQEVWVTDGQGSLYAAELVSVSDRCCAAHVKEILRRPGQEGNKRAQVHIVMAPTKHIDRTEWFLEKATEVGLGEISFIRTEHSERTVIKPERMEAVLVAAMKQSQQAYLPVMNAMCTLSEFLQRRQAEENPADPDRNPDCGQDAYPQKFIAYCGPEYEKKDLRDAIRPGSGIEVLIGPEGDFSPAEVEKCVQSGYIPVSLGNTRLRTETAALFAAWAPAFYRERR